MDRLDRYLKAAIEKVYSTNGLVGVVVIVVLLAGLVWFAVWMGLDLASLLRLVGLG